MPASYFRAAAAVLGSLVLCTLGIAVDGREHPRPVYEALSVAALVFAFVQVITAVIALDQVMSSGGSGYLWSRRP